ncbi:MAG: hypothetical protein SVZ03_03875 [Spirochaetota bacterium]|nr:hypothetical protein [Spirochaetota bacterium]
MKTVIITIIISSIGIVVYNFNDASRCLAPNKIAMESVMNIINAYPKMQRDKKAKEFLDFLGDRLDSFDFMDIYESSYLLPRDNGYRTLSFQGYNKPEVCLIKLTNIRFDQAHLLNAGDFISEFGLKKNNQSIVGDRSFTTYMKSKTSWSHFSHMNLFTFLEGIAKTIDPTNVRNLKPTASLLYTNLTDESRTVIDEFYKSFPNFSNFINRYISLLSLIKIKTYNKIPYTHLNSTGIFKKKMIKKDFPELADYLDDLYNKFKLYFELKNSNEHTILSLMSDSIESATVSLYTRSGKIIPFDNKGAPIFDEEFSLPNIKHAKYQAIMHFFMKKLGMKLNIESSAEAELLNTPTGVTIKGRLMKINNTISGRIFGIISPSLIDIFIPSNIDQLTKKFSRVMIEANNGEGSFLKHDWDTSDPNNVITHLLLKSEFLDKFFIRIGMRMMWRLFKPSIEAREDLERFIIQGFNALLLDMKNKMNKR